MSNDNKSKNRSKFNSNYSLSKKEQNNNIGKNINKSR